MSNASLTPEEVRAILELLASADHLTEFRLRCGDLLIELSRAGEARAAPSASPSRSPPPRESAPRLAGSSGEAVDRASAQQRPRAIPVTAPMFGTFYRAPAPGLPPFVAAGQRVDANSVVGLIEIMKLMHSVTAGAAGTVEQILVGDSESVESGQVLMVIAPGS